MSVSLGKNGEITFIVPFKGILVRQFDIVLLRTVHD